MRNKTLLNLQTAAEQSFNALSSYLHRLDARETDSSYIHARMLFDEGWRLAENVEGPSMYDPVHVLWMEAGDEDEDSSPVIVGANNVRSPRVLAALGLAAGAEQYSVIDFLLEITTEVDIKPGPDLVEKSKEGQND